ncbi:MAG: hypothetical protein EKK55_01010 [Rhodocyclaceae bacterium]|nr:MAG: hypothetical protein EKK55_01010 [Rhodocyclaceae bacterium]
MTTIGDSILSDERVGTAAKDAVAGFVALLAARYGTRSLDPTETRIAREIAAQRVLAVAVLDSETRNRLVDQAERNLEHLMAVVASRESAEAAAASRAALSAFVETALPIIVRAAAVAL